MPTNSKLILLRHGESIWNRDNRFTGWTDVDLTATGVEEAQRSARLLCDTTAQPDIAFTSVLKRAIRTLWIVLDELDQMWLPVVRDWRLNERHYGALQGLSKEKTEEQYGEETVYYWRRDYATRPPLLEMDDARHPRFDRRYAEIDQESLPRGESLQDTLARVMPYWHHHLFPRLAGGQTVLVVAHHNSLRALVKQLDRISDQDVPRLNIPTGFPLIYEFSNEMQVARKYYLGDDKEIEAAADAVYRIPDTIIDRYWNNSGTGAVDRLDHKG